MIDSTIKRNIVSDLAMYDIEDIMQIIKEVISEKESTDWNKVEQGTKIIVDYGDDEVDCIFLGKIQFKGIELNAVCDPEDGTYGFLVPTKYCYLK